MKPKRLLALGVLLAGVAAIAPLTKAQKSAPPQPTEQQKLKDRVDALEAQLKEAQAKADRAAMEKDYILRTQNHYESYYKEVLSTQTHILWTIGITATLLSITLTAVFFVAGRFGFTIFDRKIDSALRDATARLRTEFTETLGKETQALREANAAQLKQLEGSLEERIRDLGEDLNLRGSYSYSSNQGLALAAHQNYPAALGMYRQALESYKLGKRRGMFDLASGNPMHDLFVTLEHLHGNNVVAEVEKELANELYNDLQDELNAVALQFAWLAPLVRDRKQAAPAPQPATPTPAPTKVQESPPPAPDSTQPTRPQERKNK